MSISLNNVEFLPKDSIDSIASAKHKVKMKLTFFLALFSETPELSSPVIQAGRGGTMTPTHRTDHYVSSSSYVYEGCQSW